MRVLFVAVFAAIIIAMPAAAQLMRAGPAAMPAGMSEQQVTSGGTARYFLVQDENVRPGAPVIVLLHGGTQSMRRMFGRMGGSAQNAWREIARENGALLLVPNATNQSTGDARGDNQQWYDTRFPRAQREGDVRFIRDMLDWAAARYRFDARRVYVSGASNGGMMTYALLVDAPERFAAGAAFIANLPADESYIATPSRPTPLMIMDGTEDPMVPYNGGQVVRRNGLVRSAPASAAWWVAVNSANATGARIALPDGDPSDGCRIDGTHYNANAGGAPVVFYTVHGGGHSMPSPSLNANPGPLVRRVFGPLCRDVESARVAWEFMRGFRR